MKRLSKGSNSNRSSKRRFAAAAHVMEHEAEDEEIITTQKAKFASLYQQAAPDEDDDVDVDEDVAEEFDEDDEDEAGYVLRQKPRKTWRMSSTKKGVTVINQEQSEKQLQKKFVCSKCGKAFQSSKAMCGHMACHSEKEKPSSNVFTKQKKHQQLAVMDSQSDTESGAKDLRRRSSRRMKYKKVVVADDHPVDDSKAKVDVFNNCSSGASGVEQEQEEVAICLMMLSRDSSNWCGLNSVGDSSDNNSVVLEDRSVGTKLRKKSDGLRSFGYDVDEARKKCGSEKVKTFGDSESGSVRYGDKMVEKDLKIKISKKRKLDEGSQAEPHLSLKKVRKVMDGRLKYGLSRDSEMHSHAEWPKVDLYPRKSVENEFYTAGYNAAANEYFNTEMFQRFEHNAPIHSQSHQAFNVNVTPNHKTFTGANCFAVGESPNMRKGKGILEYSSGNVGHNLKIGKNECPMSSKVFRSSQAPSSRREVHLAQPSDEIDEGTTIFKPNGAQLHDFIDLNLPAPEEDEEANESMGSYDRFQPLHRVRHC